MITAFYGRRSKDQQNVSEEERSVTRQLDLARACAQGRGWALRDEFIFSDEISGAEFERRPGLARLLAVLKPKPPFQVLIVYDKDRLGREQIETSYIIKQLVQAGVRIFETRADGNGRELVLDSATDKVLLAVTSFAAELEREAARQRTTDAMIRKARNGHVAGGTCYGYVNVEIKSAEGQRLHVERRIVELEAAAICRAFELCARGLGYQKIARALTAESFPAPTPRRDRPHGWAPSSVREILHRKSYVGVSEWNRTRKRNRWGETRPSKRSEAEWVSVPVPALRIVTDELWNAAHERLRASREAYLRRTDGRLFGKPTNPTESRYLLTGMGVCGLCGGSFTVRTKGKGQVAYYRCLTNTQRGRAVCANDLMVPLPTAEAAVRALFETHLLRPDVVVAAIEEALRRLRPAEDIVTKARAELEREVSQLEGQIARLTEAVATGGPVEALVGGIKDRQRRREQLARQLVELEQLDRVAEIDLAVIARDLEKSLHDWRDPLAGHTAQARQVLKKLLDGRLVFTPHEEKGHRYYEFRGTGRLEPVLAGVVNEISDLKFWCPRGDSNTRHAV